MNPIHKQEREALEKLLLGLGATGDLDPVLDYCIDHYTGPDRVYHSIRHIWSALNGAHWLLPNEDPPNPRRLLLRQTAELAIWYHDLIYDTKVHNSEELSVGVLRDHAKGIHLDASVVDAAAEAIMATKHAAAPTTELAKIVVDLDLDILRSIEGRFDNYERQVRQEYAWVGDQEWITGRTKVLRGFLDRDWIYSTPTYRKLFEGDARANLKRSLARLARGEVL